MDRQVFGTSLNRILLIENEAISNKFIVDALEKNNFSVVSAFTKMRAIELLANHQFEAVISDFSEIEIDFQQLVQGLRQGRNKQTSLILQTGNHHATPEELYAQGVDALIFKPYRIEHLLQLCMRLINNRAKHAHRELRHRCFLKGRVLIREQLHECRILNYSQNGFFVGYPEAEQLTLSEKVGVKVISRDDGNDYCSGIGKVSWISHLEQSGLPNGFGIELAQTSHSLDKLLGRA